jgi:hypothetical protein
LDKNKIMNTITLENLTPTELVVYKNGLIDTTIDTTTITEYIYTYLENGIYMFENNNNKTVQINCKKLLLYYNSLELGQYCPEQYGNLVEIYTTFINKLNDECNDCL